MRHSTAMSCSGTLNVVLGFALVAIVFTSSKPAGTYDSALESSLRASSVRQVMHTIPQQPMRQMSPYQPSSQRNSIRSHANFGAHTVAASAFAPPPVSQTTSAFHQEFKFPLPMIFASFVTRLLTEHHFVRYNKKYSYNPVFALGVTSVFDQVFESLGEERKTQLFEAFIGALGESPAQYREDQATMEQWAAAKASGDIGPKADGDAVEKVLADISSSGDSFLYSKFFSIGLFRMLELSGAKDPKALESLVGSLNLDMNPVIRDLNYYKSSLSALIAAQELKKEAEARAKKKMEEAKAKKTEMIKKMASKKM